MKITEARAKAKELWGVLGFAKLTRYGYRYVGYTTFYTINNKTLSTEKTMGFSHDKGIEKGTWEECFERAANNQ